MIRQYKPTTPASRGKTSQDFDAVTTRKPLKSLLTIKKKQSGRNNQGRITTRHRGGGTRKFYRKVNFSLSTGSTATVEHIEYDPNRTARIARVKDGLNNYHYVLAAHELAPGMKIASGEEAPIEVGNRLPLKNIPVGSTVHAIELKVGGGAQLVRSAGASAQLVARDDKYAQVKLPSGEVRLINANCTAAIGLVGNLQHQNIKIGKAGRNRLKGIRPTVRGMAMNAADHPHGGGEGRGKGGNVPRTPWGQKTLGLKTRRRKSTSTMIVRSRHAAKRK